MVWTKLDLRKKNVCVAHATHAFLLRAVLYVAVRSQHFLPRIFYDLFIAIDDALEV